VVREHFWPEAAMIACNIPANINQRICFRKMEHWDNDLFDAISDSFEACSRISLYHKRYYDKAPSAVQKTKDNIKMLILTSIFLSKNKKLLIQNFEGKLHVVFNPPYDERLDIHMEEFYKILGYFKEKSIL
jgi:putative N6-adenine-specific DNA methylase